MATDPQLALYGNMNRPGYSNIEMKRAQMITYSVIICTSDHSGALLDSNVINSSLTLIDLSWPGDTMSRIIHQLFPLADPAR